MNRTPNSIDIGSLELTDTFPLDIIHRKNLDLKRIQLFLLSNIKKIIVSTRLKQISLLYVI